jgi:hypothetical protein
MAERSVSVQRSQTSLGRNREVVLLLGILILAGALRVIAVPACLPYISYVDEGHILHPVMRVLVEGGWDKGWVHYPSFLINATALVARAYRPIYDATHGAALPEAIPGDPLDAPRSFSTYDLIGPPELVVLARLVVLTFGVALVLATWALARSSFGAAAGAWAALFAAVTPALVTRSSIVIVDTPAAFFTTAALVVAVRLLDLAGSLLPLSALAGACVGLAFTSKYPSGAVALAVGAALALGPARRSFFRNAAVAAAGFVAAAALSMPLLVHSPGIVLFTLKAEAAFYRSRATPLGYIEGALLPREVGVPLALLGLIGLIMLAFRAETRRFSLVLLAFALPFLLSFSWAPFKPFRNTLPLLPLACVAAGVAMSRLGSTLTRRHVGLVVSIAFGLSTTGWTGWQSWRLQREAATRIDSRIEAVTWLRAHVLPGQRVLVAAEAGILPSELRRFPLTPVVVPVSELAVALSHNEGSLLVVPVVAVEESPDLAFRAAYRDLRQSLAGKKPVFECGEDPVPPFLNFWRGNRPRIEVFQTLPPP